MIHCSHVLKMLFLYFFHFSQNGSIDIPKGFLGKIVEVSLFRIDSGYANLSLRSRRIHKSQLISLLNNRYHYNIKIFLFINSGANTIYFYRTKDRL